MYIYIYVCIYLYIYIERERERMNTATIPFFYTAVESDSLIAVLWHVSSFSSFDCQ